MNAVERLTESNAYMALFREYVRYLERQYGVFVDQLTPDLFDHLRAEAARDTDPRSAVVRMAHEAGLVHCGVMFPNVKDVGKYNSYVLALREYALENNLNTQKVTGAVFCDVGVPAVIIPYMYTDKANQKFGFKIFDMDGRFLGSGPDIGDTIELARNNVYKMLTEETQKYGPKFR